MKEIKKYYKNGYNIMKILRELEGRETNSLKAIMIAYDLQTGNYIESLQKPDKYNYIHNYSKTIANLFNDIEYDSILEVGVGEGITIKHVYEYLKNKPKKIFGFDISWSRIAYGLRYLQENKIPSDMFVGDLFEIPMLDNSIDIVYTSHSIEPNRGKEKEAIKELYRITKKYLILLEPSFELGNSETKKHIEEHVYCKNLYDYAKELNLNVIENRLFDYSNKSNNQTQLLIIEKNVNSNNTPSYACPVCKQKLIFHNDNYFCEDCSLIYPVINKIPCLTKNNSILGSKYMKVEKLK